MKKSCLFVILMLMVALPASAQLNVNIFTGLTFSAFEDQDESATALPLGVAVGFSPMPNLEVGGEINLALPGYGFETSFYGEKITTTFHQNLFGVYGRYYFDLADVALLPFVKAGLGLYTGGVTVSGDLFGEEVEENMDVDSAVGINLGAGVMLKNGLYGEFNYNILSRKLSESESSDSYGANTWAIHVGYRLKL